MFCSVRHSITLKKNKITLREQIHIIWKTVSQYLSCWSLWPRKFSIKSRKPLDKNNRMFYSPTVCHWEKIIRLLHFLCPNGRHPRSVWGLYHPFLSVAGSQDSDWDCLYPPIPSSPPHFTLLIPRESLLSWESHFPSCPECKSFIFLAPAVLLAFSFSLRLPEVYNHNCNLHTIRYRERKA